MKVRVIDKPCLFAETVYLLYYYINGIAYTRDYERVNRKFGRYLLEKEDQGLQLAQELDRISAAVTQTLDPHQARLRYFFEKLPGTDEKTCCARFRSVNACISAASCSATGRSSSVSSRR